MTRRTYTIATIVEGHGETLAVPILLQRWFKRRRFLNFEVADPIRASSVDAIKAPHREELQLGIEHFVELASRIVQPDAILVLIDSEGDCPKLIAPELLERALAVTNIPIGIVLANRQYETWFLASLRTLQRAGKIPADAKLPRYADVESEQGCKEKLSKLLGRKYNERNDQPEFTRHLLFTKTMKTKSRSYFHLLTTLERLVSEARN